MRMWNFMGKNQNLLIILIILQALGAFDLGQAYSCYRYKQRISRYSHYSWSRVVYYTRYSRRCGWFGWRRCTGYNTYYRYKFVYHPTTYRAQSYCCYGYRGSPPFCYAICNPSCVHGSCTSPGRCKCRTGWAGSRCNIPICSPRCVYGRCRSPGRCSCQTRWSGSRCNIPICNPSCVHGRCSSPGKCTCNAGWIGSSCTTPICNPSCVNGRCSSPGRCSCHTGWTGSRCNIPICNPSCVNGKCSSPGKCTCQSGWTGSRCNIAICNPSCIYGRCTSPGKCTCEAGWTGSRCRDDKNLLSWCSSISNGEINEDSLSKVRSSLKVYCGSQFSTAFVRYNSNLTSKISPKMNADFKRCSSSKSNLIHFWKQHSNVRDFCCFTSNRNYLITLLNKLKRFDSNFHSSISCLTASVAVELRKELKSHCSKSISDVFCPITAALSLIDRVALLPSDKSKWTADTKLFRKAVLVNFLVLKKNYQAQFRGLVLVEDEVFYDSTNAILQYMRNKEVSKLQTLAKHLPPTDAYKIKNEKTCGNDDLCLFMKMVEQIYIYLDEATLDDKPLLADGKKRLVLNTEVDYREFLRQKQLDRILTVLNEQGTTSKKIAEHLKEHTTTKFTELRSYFEKVETFNQEIADADIAYIKGRIVHYQKKVKDTKEKLSDEMTCLIAHAMVVGGLDISSKLPFAYASFILPLRLFDSIFEKAFNNILEGVEDLIDIGTSLTSIRKKCFKNISTSLFARKQFFGVIKDLVNKGKDIVTDIVKGGTDKIKDLFETGKEYIKNPGKIITDLGGAIKDGFEEIVDGINILTDVLNPLNIKKRITDAFNSVTKFLPLIGKMKAVYGNFEKLIEESKTIHNKLKKNDQFLKNLEKLIRRNTLTRREFEASKDEFLRDYNSYDPAVKKYEISGMATLWNKLVEASCETIDSVNTPEAVLIQSQIYKEDLCTSCTKLAGEMISMYEAIFDFQFELIDAMVAYVRSSVALDAAKEISTKVSELSRINPDKGVTLTTLAMIGGLSYTAYKAHVLQTVHQYCNVLEYMEGDTNPSECKGIHTNVALLIANTRPMCLSETIHYYNIPTEPSGEDDKAYVNITDLFAGSEVTFQISSSQWLEDHDWILPEEKDHAFYVKQFEVFLPIKTSYPRKFYAKADPVSKNVVRPNSTEYIIIPSVPLIHEYTIGPSRLICKNNKQMNPYTSCETEKVSEVCDLSYPPRQHLYPSIYTQWTLSVKGGESFKPPQFATKLSVLAALQLCKIAPDNYIREEPISAVIAEKSQCCMSGKFRPNVTSACQSCPDGSHSELAGYYCEKDKQLAQNATVY